MKPERPRKRPGDMISHWPRSGGCTGARCSVRGRPAQPQRRALVDRHIAAVLIATQAEPQLAPIDQVGDVLGEVKLPQTRSAVISPGEPDSAEDGAMKPAPPAARTAADLPRTATRAARIIVAGLPAAAVPSP